MLLNQDYKSAQAASVGRCIENRKTDLLSLSENSRCDPEMLEGTP